MLGGHRVKVRNKENKWGIKAVESGGKKKKRNKLHFYKKRVHPILQTGNYLKLETRYVKTVVRNGIYDKFCIGMGVFWIFDKIEENRYFSQAFHLKPLGVKMEVESRSKSFTTISELRAVYYICIYMVFNLEEKSYIHIAEFHCRFQRTSFS